MLRQMLGSTKYIILVAIVTIYVAAVALILYETAVVASAIIATVREGAVSLDGARLLAVGLLAAIDVFLIAMATSPAWDCSFCSLTTPCRCPAG